MEEGWRMLIYTNWKSNKGLKLIKQMTKKKTKNEMELNQHKIWNHEKKKVTDCGQRHRTKTRGRRLHRGWRKKTSQVPHMIHLSLIWILSSSTVNISKKFWNEVKWRQLNNTKSNLISGWEKHSIGSKCIMKYWWPEQNYMSWQNHRQPVNN